MFLETMAASSLILASAGQPPWCRPDRMPVVNVGLIAPNPRSDLSKTIADLEKFHIDTKNPYGAQIETHVGGLTDGTVRVSQRIQVSGARLATSSCLWVSRVDVTIRLDQIVYVARDFGPGTCRHMAVWDHEHKHVRTDREIINKYRPIYEQAVRDAMARTDVIGPIPNGQESSIQNAMSDAVKLAIARTSQQMEKEREDRQQAIDSREEYDRVSALCRNK